MQIILHNSGKICIFALHFNTNLILSYEYEKILFLIYFSIAKPCNYGRDH